MQVTINLQVAGIDEAEALEILRPILRSHLAEDIFLEDGLILPLLHVVIDVPASLQAWGLYGAEEAMSSLGWDHGIRPLSCGFSLHNRQARVQ